MANDAKRQQNVRACGHLRHRLAAGIDSVVGRDVKAGDLRNDVHDTVRPGYGGVRCARRRNNFFRLLNRARLVLAYAILRQMRLP